MGVKKVLRIVILLFTYFFLIIGVILGIIVVTGGWEAIGILLDMILPQLAGLAFIYLIIMLLIIRLKWGQKKWLAFAVILGFLSFTLNMLPLTSPNAAVQSAETQFIATFGPNWNDAIPADLKFKFMNKPYSLWDYYKGASIAPCNVSYDIEYALLNGNDSMRFDVYLPPSGEGPFPTIIAIHGGGWVLGDKGTGNFFQTSRYLASQGYAVFDIIYGLADVPDFPDLSFIGSVKYNNSYTIPQMIENIGKFTDYLAIHANEYHVNLSQTYVLGRSAGAHLAALVGLGYTTAPFSTEFNQSISIQGVLLYYPPMNMTTMLENSLKITKLYSWLVDIQEMFDYLMEYNVTNYNIYSGISYVDSNSPPVFIVHGKKDHLVPYAESVALQKAMEDAGRPCILIGMPFCGHAFGLLNNNFYKQITHYYLERFLALTTILTV
ncbi:MAG TPA: alpha/beta hydrolase [Candidatus Deferrimicrobium sp.]|nr:alpha/beta hydrolase [Candidatus Deferrimicrobium sp.]